MTAEPILAGTELLGFPVSINEVERRLTEVIGGGDDSESGVTRASVLNLALYSERPGNLPQDAETIAEVTREAACRTILICVDPAERKTAPQAFVQAHCLSDKNGKKAVCSEQISFVLSGNSPSLVRNTVFSHLDSDLPLVFWWRGEFSDVFEAQLYSRIDRLIFDSEGWTTPRNQFLRLLTAIRSGQGSFRFHDLAFTRLNLIRQSIANAFDQPTLRHRVDQIESLLIRYPKNQKMSAMYLGAWLASRIRGELDKSRSSEGQYFFRSTAREFPAEIRVKMEMIESGDFSCAIKVGNHLIEVTRCPDRHFLRTLITDGATGQSTEDWLPYPPRTEAALVTHILQRGGRNRSLAQLIDKTREMMAV